VSLFFLPVLAIGAQNLARDNEKKSISPDSLVRTLPLLFLLWRASGYGLVLRPIGLGSRGGPGVEAVWRKETGQVVGLYAFATVGGRGLIGCEIDGRGQLEMLSDQEPP
jgi:hypothetical protein